MTLLAQKLRAEISYEAEVHFGHSVVDVGQIQDTPANDEVFPTRRIRVMFSIAELRSIPDEDEPDQATDDEGPRVGTSRRCPIYPGTLLADLYCADGAFDVANFESLDPALNDFEARLREHGVGGALAGFLPRYALWKEQRVTAEYLEWLHGVEGFVKA
ncbi:hypothetical protein B0H14DRAFT_3524169 [Mycena olivaceomarginata]|nr:hypothetical protein B0H14DRAFT_3524169 [Mycena olivaceomarginata]